jgi:hypothetical protein
LYIGINTLYAKNYTFYLWNNKFKRGISAKPGSKSGC